MELQAKKYLPDERNTTGRIVLSAVFAIISILWMMPIVVVLYNSFKTNGAV